MQKHHLMIPVAFGLERVVAYELETLGVEDVMVEKGVCFFDGDDDLMMKVNMALRTAERVYKVLKVQKVLTFDELFNVVEQIPWETYLDPSGAFVISAKSQQSTLFSLRDIQKLTKKALLKRLEMKTSSDIFPETGPSYHIAVHLEEDIMMVLLDTSGEALHKRGYRLQTGGAPLKETLAAALVLLSVYRKERVLYDPFCGSGTIPIEAAMIARNKAPNRERTFAFESFLTYDQARHLALKETLKKEEVTARIAPIYASDNDASMIALAKENAARAGVLADIDFQTERFETKRFEPGHHLIISNPPYGERMQRLKDIERLYEHIGRTFKRLKTYSLFLISSTSSTEKLLDLKPTRTRVLFNGPIKTRYYQFLGPKPPHQ